MTGDAGLRGDRHEMTSRCALRELVGDNADLGRHLARGFHVSVPPGQPHDLATGPAGVTIGYLYVESDDHG